MNEKIDNSLLPLKEQAFFLSEILGVKVTIAGKKIGKLVDVIIKENGSLPVVTHIQVARPFGESAVVPWEKIGSLSPKEITLTVENIATVSYTHLTLPTKRI